MKFEFLWIHKKWLDFFSFHIFHIFHPTQPKPEQVEIKTLIERVKKKMSKRSRMGMEQTSIS